MKPSGPICKEAGIEALSTQGMGLETAEGFAAVPPQEIYDFPLNAWKNYADEADGLFISCMNYEIGKPVVTSHSATLWRVLSQAGETGPLYGYGRAWPNHGLICGRTPPVLYRIQK